MNFKPSTAPYWPILDDYEIDCKKVKKLSDILRNRMFVILDKFHALNENKDDLFFAGGCIASLYHEILPVDYDLYIKSPETHDRIKMSLDVADIDCRNGKPQYNSIYLKYSLHGSKINLINMYNSPPKETVEQFDMLHAVNYFDFADEKLYLRRDAVYCIEKKLLLPRTPKSKVKRKRIKKYVDRGWRNGVPEENIIDTK